MSSQKSQAVRSSAEDVVQTNAQESRAVVVEVAGKGKGGFSSEPKLGELVEFQLTGLLVVFSVLGSITLVCYLISLVLKTIAPDQYHVRAKK